jgi:hypothetical protein
VKAAAGKLPEAIAILTSAEERTGLPPRNLLMKDPDMVPLRGYPGFDVLIERAVARRPIEPVGSDAP